MPFFPITAPVLPVSFHMTTRAVSSPSMAARWPQDKVQLLRQLGEASQVLQSLAQMPLPLALLKRLSAPTSLLIFAVGQGGGGSGGAKEVERIPLSQLSLHCPSELGSLSLLSTSQPPHYRPIRGHYSSLGTGPWLFCLRATRVSVVAGERGTDGLETLQRHKLQSGLLFYCVAELQFTYYLIVKACSLCPILLF